VGKYIAEPYKAASPDVMVIGQTMQAFLENVQADLIRDILKKQGIEDIDAEKWYPHQLWMDILKSIEESFEGSGSQSAFVAFGRKVVEKAVMPPEMNSIPIVLNALHAIHHMNLQNAPEDEGFIIEEVDDKHYLVYENTPNPTDAIYGYIWGICARFREEGQDFMVEIVPNPKPDEQPGTVYKVTWG